MLFNECRTSNLSGDLQTLHIILCSLNCDPRNIHKSVLLDSLFSHAHQTCSERRRKMPIAHIHVQFLTHLTLSHEKEPTSVNVAW